MPTFDRFDRFARVARRSTWDTTPCYTQQTKENNAVALYPSVARTGNDPLDTEALRDAFEERAAILEFDAGLSRPEAERIALKMIKLDDLMV